MAGRTFVTARHPSPATLSPYARWNDMSKQVQIPEHKSISSRVSQHLEELFERQQFDFFDRLPELAAERSCRRRARLQPRAAGREHYGVNLPWPGTAAQASGPAEGGASHGFPGGGPLASPRLWRAHDE